MKILLVRNDNIGDLICTTPAIEALRKTYPDAQIDIVVNSLNSCVVERNPYLDKIYIYTKPKHKKRLKDKILAFLGKCKILFKIYKEKYDVVVIFRSSYSPSAALFARVANTKRVLGVDDKKPQKFITDKIVFNENLHEVMLCFEILKPLGVIFSGEKTLYVPKNPSDEFKDFVFFHISSRIEQNRISDDKIEQIVTFLKQIHSVVITSENENLAKNISQKTAVRYLKTKNLDELANYLWVAKFIITLDGGIAHLAPALRLKTFVIFGKTNLKRWRPWGEAVVVFKDDSGLAQNIDLDGIFNEISAR